MPDMPMPVLYSFRRCPYAMRARMAVDYSGLSVELREVLLRDKPAAMLALSDKKKVPVMQQPDGGVLDESLDIMLWALSQADPDDWLNNKACSLALIDRCDNEFKPWLDRYKYADRYPAESAEHYRSQGQFFLNDLEQHLTETGHLCSDAMSLADIAVAPFVRQFAHVDKAWFDAQTWTHLQQWLKDILESSLFTRCMVKYERWQPGMATALFPLA